MPHARGERILYKCVYIPYLYRIHRENVPENREKRDILGHLGHGWGMGRVACNVTVQKRCKTLQNVAFGLKGQATRKGTRKGCAGSRGAIHAGCFKRRRGSKMFHEMVQNVSPNAYSMSFPNLKIVKMMDAPASAGAIWWAETNVHGVGNVDRARPEPRASF